MKRRDFVKAGVAGSLTLAASGRLVQDPDRLKFDRSRFAKPSGPKVRGGFATGSMECSSETIRASGAGSFVQGCYSYSSGKAVPARGGAFAVGYAAKGK